MAIVNFLGPINKKPINININNFDELKNELHKMDDLKQWIPICAIAVNDEIISKTDNIAIKNDDIISLLPPVCGG